MKNLLTFTTLVLIIASCSRNTQKEQEPIETEKYTDSIKTTTIYQTLPDGDVKNLQKDVTVFYNTQNIKIDFKDSVWKFKIIDIQTDHKGTTITVEDKRFKQIFISGGGMPIITFETHSEKERLTLM